MWIMGSIAVELPEVDIKRPSDPNSSTGKLCDWIESIRLETIPEEIRKRSKYLILDGIACLLIGAQLPWSARASETIFSFEGPGPCTVAGWNRKISPVHAALLNATYLQGFELDDWHSEAPLHSNSIILPALLAAAEHGKVTTDLKISGADFLLATIVGYEVGPRVGLGLWGGHMLTMGWHSGAVFGPSAAAAAVSKLLGLNAGMVEDALGNACAQACGLMSAQYESEVKRMQHGFAARNGLLGALLARNGFTGIKRVYEREYGGFLAQFSKGNGKTPQYRPEEISKALGEVWKTENIRVKPYAAMAGTHPTVDCVKVLQAEHPEKMKDYTKIRQITIEMGDVAFHHGGWEATFPLTVTGAQMSNSYIGATQIVDRQVLAAQFRPEMLHREEVWTLVHKTTCVQNDNLPARYSQRMTIEFEDGEIIKSEVRAAKGVDPELSNEEIVEKWRSLMKGVIDDQRREKIEDFVLGIEHCSDIVALGELLIGTTANPIA